MAAEVLKTDDDPAAPDDQDPDAPERPMAEKNDVSNEREQYRLLGAQESQGLKIVGNHVATESKEQGAKEELQESPTLCLP